MKPNLDPAQYGNQPVISIQHYLINMIHRILTAVDKSTKSEAFAVIDSLIDWENAFPRQCPKLGIESFMRNGVRPALIPVLINYFQDRKMSVKWRGVRSLPRTLKGGGPQGATMGLLEYLSQSDDCAAGVNESERFRFLDDLSILEIINLLTVGLTSFNLKHQVPNDVAIHNQFIDSRVLKSQEWLSEINTWTQNQKMKINGQKTKNMIFNFSDKYQFSTRLAIDGKPIEVINSTKLLGTIITSDLKWDKNTNHIVKKANARMELIRKVASFGAKKEDLKNLYILFVRSQLEQSAVVWHSSLTEEKSAIKIIMGEEYQSYRKSLNFVNLDIFEERRKMLCLKFAKSALKNEKASKMKNYMT